jgi:hypothetical protein
MGWFFSQQHNSKKDFIAHRTRRQRGQDDTTFTCLAHSVRGNTLYTVWEVTHPNKPAHRFIGIDLLSKTSDGWGYKDMCESMGIYKYDCPLKFFDMVPEPPNEHARKWRDKVRAIAKGAKERRKMLKDIKVGDVIRLREGCTPETIEVSSLKPIRGFHNGTRYRIPPRYIVAIESTKSC